MKRRGGGVSMPPVPSTQSPSLLLPRRQGKGSRHRLRPSLPQRRRPEHQHVVFLCCARTALGLELVRRVSTAAEEDDDPSPAFVLTPPSAALPAEQRGQQRSREETWMQRALSDTVGRCGPTSWSRRSPVAAAFCGTAFRPLPPLAQAVHDEIGGVHSLLLLLPGDRDDHDDDAAARQQRRGFNHDEKPVLFAFGTGHGKVSASRSIATAGSKTFIPSDWCFSSFCAASAEERSTSVMDARARLRAFICQSWSRSRVAWFESGGRVATAFAAGGAAPLRLFAHAIPEDDGGDDEELHVGNNISIAAQHRVSRNEGASSAVTTLSTLETMIDVVGGPWATYIPWRVSWDGHRDHAAAASSSSTSSALPVQSQSQQRANALQRRSRSFASGIISPEQQQWNRRDAAKRRELRQAAAGLTAMLRGSSSSTSSSARGGGGGHVASPVGDDVSRVSVAAKRNIAPLADAALAQVAQNHRLLVRQLRSGSHVQAAYLAGLLVLVALTSPCS